MDPLTAMRDFRRARRRAALEKLWARIQKRPVDLLPFEPVQRYLRGYPLVFQGLQEIPLDAIVGSVGRYRDFTRHFFPLQSDDEARWTKVLRLQHEHGLPPIEVYKVGEVYFVKDGHHRVSVARSTGAPTIEAYVTEVQAPVPLSPDDDPRTAILKAEAAYFQQVSRIAEVLPDADIRLTEPGQYEWLLRDIHEHAQRLREARGISVPWEEVVRDWYAQVYQPVVETIRRLGLLKDFPHRTEADLYVWLLKHRKELHRRLGWDVRPESAAPNLLPTRRPSVEVLAQARRSIATRDEALLFREILVALPTASPEARAQALDQALTLARGEGRGARLVAIVVRTEHQDTTSLSAIQEEVARRADEAGVAHRFLEAQSREVAETLCAYARWADILIVPLQYPPPERPFWARWRSGFRKLVRLCPRPILAVPQATSLRRLLVGYDGSPRAREALYCAAYWVAKVKGDLAVVYVSLQESPVLGEARRYLSSVGLQATYIHHRNADPVAGLLAEATSWQAEAILVGGYGTRVLEPVMGSTVDGILRARRVPVWIFP